MFKEGILDKILHLIKKFIPKRVFNFLAPAYHSILAIGGAILYGLPSRKLKIIGVTGTKGKSTTVYMISKIFEEANIPVAAIGSLGYKIKNREWPNHLKMTMPGRFKLQKFLSQSLKEGAEYVVLEVTSEGIKQKRHLGIKFDCALLTNIAPEHLEGHGGFENYKNTKKNLFKKIKKLHVLNLDDKYISEFSKIPSAKKIFYSTEEHFNQVENLPKTYDSVEFMEGSILGGSFGTSFKVEDVVFNLKISGNFNVYNALAAISVSKHYGLSLDICRNALEKIDSIKGRMEIIQKFPFKVVVDYAHTPDSLEAVYANLQFDLDKASKKRKLICVLGAAGGGRDKWKRSEFGKIADRFCDEIVLTNEDPYEEDPETILIEIEQGILNKNKIRKIIDRREAIKFALTDAEENDIVIITGKGSEVSMAIAGGKKIPWSDKEVTLELLKDI